jgi:hypothetical protein
MKVAARWKGSKRRGRISFAQDLDQDLEEADHFS